MSTNQNDLLAPKATIQAAFYDPLCVAISRQRLTRCDQNDGDLNMMARYLYNTALCEALYPLLQHLEVSLRNSWHHALTAEYSRPDWYDLETTFLWDDEVGIVEKAIKKLDRQKRPVDPDHIVAELTLGFWTTLLDLRYEYVLWPRLLKSAFPRMNRTLRTRVVLSSRFNRIRTLRNRVFHHEPIWHWRDLGQQHQELVEAIEWLNPELATVAKAGDRFPGILAAGITPFRAQLLAIEKIILPPLEEE